MSTTSHEKSLPPNNGNAAIFANASRAPRTAGEKNFDWKVYGGVGLGANVAISIGALWGADRTHSGKYILDNAAKAIANITKIDTSKIRRQIRYTTLLSGGFAVLIPMKLLEDNKLEIVKRYDTEHYAAIPNADSILEPAYARLAQEPKQSWASILGSRLLAMVPFYTLTNIGMRKEQWLARATGESVYVEKLITQAARGIDKLLHRKNPEALKEIAEKNRLYPDRTVNDLNSGTMERTTTALADYTITEVTTSSIVAAFVYLFKHVTAPVLGNPADQPNSRISAKDISQYRLLAQSQAEERERV